MNKEKRKAQLKQYQEEHKEEIKIKKKEYYQKNKGLILKKAKKYRNKSKVKLYQKEYNKRYYQNNKESLLKKNSLYRQQPEVKKNIKKYEKERQQTPKRQTLDRKRNQKPKRKAYNKKYHRKYMKERRQTDEEFRIIYNLRNHFGKAMRLYSTTGKIMSSKKYGIDFKAIIEHLRKKPNDGNIYEADHIIPLCKFNHNDPEQVKKAWAPENFQWLTREINQWKGDRLIKPLTDEEKEKLQAQLTKNN